LCGFFQERGFSPVFLFCGLVEIFYNGEMTAGFIFFTLTVTIFPQGCYPGHSFWQDGKRFLWFECTVTVVCRLAGGGHGDLPPAIF